MIRINVEKSIYSKEVLLKTAYSFTDRAYLHLSQDEHNWIIEWKGKREAAVEPGDFENELISQQLREKLLEETADIRKMILARAFASTIIEQTTQNSEKDDRTIIGDSETDNGILKDWFKQHDGI